MLRGTYKLVPNILLQRVADEMVILDPANGQYYGLNDSGARIIMLLSDGQDLASIARQMLEEYDVERAPLERDIQKLIGELTRHGLVTHSA